MSCIAKQNRTLISFLHRSLFVSCSLSDFLELIGGKCPLQVLHSIFRSVASPYVTSWSVSIGIRSCRICNDIHSLYHALTSVLPFSNINFSLYVFFFATAKSTSFFLASQKSKKDNQSLATHCLQVAATSRADKSKGRLTIRLPFY